MNAEAIIVLVYLRYLRKTLKTFSPNPEWDRLLNLSFFATLALMVLEIVFHVSHITVWLWQLVEVILIAATFQLDMFQPARKLMIGLIPLMVLLFLTALFENVFPGIYKKIDKFFDIANAIAITWMTAVILLANKERKLLEKERQKRLLEEERNRIIEEQKVQLETLVAIRTHEITRQNAELETTLVELQSTQKQLIQAEKMASLGELTAGIAHEIQNPLNFVNNFSEVSVELIGEMKEELKAGNAEAVIEIAQDIEKNLYKISHHGKRADAIVKGMLQHSRSSTGKKEPVDINALADEYLRLSYHGLRAKDKNFNATMVTHYDEGIGMVEIVPQDLGRVFLNLYTNAFYSVAAKKKAVAQTNPSFDPKVTVITKLVKNGGEDGEDIVWISVKDNGMGIPQQVLDKIYQPFFTTKPSGEGTGLGLSLSYDIIYKVHNGKMTVDTKEGEYAEFIIQIPITKAVI
ncbi:MAG: two-component sensor histidine kinase [Chitinophagaceae bacterium]|nr:two-component sensor histidine kinase [Chitinophagaceae bacterium]